MLGCTTSHPLSLPQTFTFYQAIRFFQAVGLLANFVVLLAKNVMANFVGYFSFSFSTIKIIDIGHTISKIGQMDPTWAQDIDFHRKLTTWHKKLVQ